MLALSRTSIAIRRGFGAALLASTAGAVVAQAQTITINQMTATGGYVLNGAVSDSLTDTSSGAGAFVDVLSFPFGPGSGAGMHSYGSSNGVFGSRSSGFGVFDVNGSYVINLTITNNQVTSHNAVFGFHITPGLLELTDLPYAGLQFVETGLAFNITSSNGRTFASAATLRSDASGLSFNATGDRTLYGGAGADRFVLGGDRTLDLGILAAGESVTLNYAITSYAKGNAILGQAITQPQRTVTIPGYWVSGCSPELPQLAPVAAPATPAAGAACTADPVFVAEQTITLPETTVAAGDAGSAQASSGDPFAFNLGPNQLVLPSSRNGSPVGVTLTQANVPNPGPNGNPDPNPTPAPNPTPNPNPDPNPNSNPNPNPNPSANTNPVPEPGALSLTVLALAAAAAATRGGKKAA